MANKSPKTAEKPPKPTRPQNVKFDIEIGEGEAIQKQSFQFVKGIVQFNLPGRGIVTVADAMKSEEILAELVEMKAGIIEKA